MPYTRHGHAYGTLKPNEPKPSVIARCGGLVICDTCKNERDRSLRQLIWYKADPDNPTSGYWPDCGTCQLKLGDPSIRATCASVGIEHNKDTDQMLYEYLNTYHANGHWTS